jgi:rhamnosyltransferase
MSTTIKASVVIRTYNEEQDLAQLLESIHLQDLGKENFEVIIVDSGSTDRTLEIATKYMTKIHHISKSEFTFGKSLNLGCSISSGEVLVFISGHCIPTSRDWLRRLIEPILNNEVVMTYGRQVGVASTRFSENQIFKKYFPDVSQIPQDGIYTNNANSALKFSVWNSQKFDESLTGLEDMYIAKRLVADGHRIGYVSDAVVSHRHMENWQQVRRRFEREAIALHRIMPEIHFTFLNLVRYTCSSVTHDVANLALSFRALGQIVDIVGYRTAQYWGAFSGSRNHREISKAKKDSFFYPRP